jgi:urease gamma subunit
MTMIYNSDSKKYLGEFIDEIVDKDSTIVIPDLQRPYVWSPRDVILLIDSIFKKWPFGSLLCWEIKRTDSIGYLIPHRPFWSEYVRPNVPKKESKAASTDESAKSYLMILDGQQRLQSLLLALGGESWGFTLTDNEWEKDIYGTEKDIANKYWSTGCLCIEVSSFLSEYENCNCKIAGIDVAKFLRWVVTNKDTGLPPYTNESQVLPVASLDDGNFIRFSKLWKIAKPGSGSLPNQYEDILKSSFAEISSEKLNNFIRPLSEFMTIIAEVKDSTPITCLTIKDFKKSGIDEPNVYNDAIVNIFSRLNTAGRTLTKQEITLAWLKTGWRNASTETGKPIDCDKVLLDLLAELNGNDDNRGMKMSMDNLVDILSLFWIITERNGDNKNELVLNDKDLVNSNIMKNIGKHTYKHWETIKDAINDCKRKFEERDLDECFARPGNAFYIICGWQFIVEISSHNNEGRKIDTECTFDTQINPKFDIFIDKWFFSTLLSNIWSDQYKYPYFVGRLCKLHKSIIGCQNPHSSIDLLVKELETILSDLKQSTINRINDIRAYDRRGVTAYKNILWLWNRLKIERWTEVKNPMKRKHAKPKLEVDHAISFYTWKEKIANAYPISIDATTGQETDLDINGEKYKRSDLLSMIHLLGNCSLLLKSQNRSKGKDSFGVFLRDVYSNNSEQIEKIKNALLLNETFLFPEKASTIQQILVEIKDRTNKIKSELIDYFNNKEQKREDVT